MKPTPSKGLRNTRRALTVVCVSSLLLFLNQSLDAKAETFEIIGPLGPISVEIPHVDPGGSLVAAAPLESREFRPPSIFSAPLPSGSGARALGLAGAFTAVADDATAASWNPAGLIQLEVPEASFMFRAAYEEQDHHSGSDSFNVGQDEFGNVALNYLSVVYPFRLADRNMVFSANYQEAYDFKQKFTASYPENATERNKSSSSAVFEDTISDHFENPFIEIDLVSDLTTRQESTVQQVINSDRLTDIDFEQEGIIDALTPSIAVEITPTFYVGASFNHYQDSLFGEGIESKTRAKYSGMTSSRATIKDKRTTSGTYSFSGTLHPPVGPDVPFGPTGGTYPEFSDTSSSRISRDLYIDGELEEVNRFDDLHGYNATFGALWTVNRVLSLGATVDLPWTADAEQKKTVHLKETTYGDEARTKVLSVRDETQVEQKDVEFDFPLYWAVGAVLRLNDRFYTAVDISQTLWSDFAFEAEGEGKINPLDGTPHGQNKIDDTWSIRGGMEYLLVLKTTEIPLRGGIAWEQRPAIGDPDEFWNFSLGSGISIGQGPGKIIIDFAYTLTYGNDVLGSLVPGQNTSTDVVEHQGFVSCIRHF